MTTSVDAAATRDGAPASSPGAEPASAPVTATARAACRSSRGPALLLGTLVVVSVVLALLSARGTTGRLDPSSYEPEGSRALAALLRAEGVAVHEVRTVADAEAASGRNTTLLITDPAMVPAAALARLAERHADTVLIAPGPPALEAFAPGLAPSGQADVKRRAPQCGLPAAVAAGQADLGGIAYSVVATATGRGSEASVLCYPTQDGGTLARAGTVTVLGGGDPLTNDRLDQDGDAALSLGLLGEHRDLIWYRPSLGDPALKGGQKPLWSLVPAPVRLAALQLGLGVVLLALWRGRRLGPVVAEPLPVVVRAAEATEGRARLYRRAGARDRAADALRSATLDRVAPRFGLGPGSDPDAVTEAVARRTGRGTQAIAALLYGSAPADDAALVALADALDELEREVRTP
jgi:hypothetical protein